jgi:hypothetical protein
VARTLDPAEVFVLQVAQLGGAKLGFEDDPEGAWIVKYAREAGAES